MSSEPPVRLRELERCFHGAVPATIATCSPEGTPNITYLSLVHMVDDDHVALSFQFFNKTRENILQHPRAELLVADGVTLEQYRLDVRYQRTENTGPVFERLRTNLDAVASQTGMSGIFRLQGADIYRVERIEKLAHDLDLAVPEGHADFVAALATLSERMAACDDLEALLDETLLGLAELFGYGHAMVLVADESGRVLYTVASHGFASSGIGAEVVVGEGLIGTAARERRPVRVVNMRSERVLAEAMRETARQGGQPLAAGREIPLPGLADAQSAIAVPLLARERLLGVLCVQSPQLARLTLDDERALSTLARHLAASMQIVGGEPSPARRDTSGERLRVRHHAADDSVFLGDEYLIKGLPGRILVRLLEVHQREGRVEFSNRELRLDASLQLGGYRDNLEARLILLRRRLEERTALIRLTRAGRGRFRLELGRAVDLVQLP